MCNGFDSPVKGNNLKKIFCLSGKFVFFVLLDEGGLDLLLLQWCSDSPLSDLLITRGDNLSPRNI